MMMMMMISRKTKLDVITANHEDKASKLSESLVDLTGSHGVTSQKTALSDYICTMRIILRV
jgi:hypothetical protein